MPRFILKIEDNSKEYYMEYSTVVDAPITYGMDLETFKRYWKEEYGRQGEGRFNRSLSRSKPTEYVEDFHTKEDLLEYCNFEGNPLVDFS